MRVAYRDGNLLRDSYRIARDDRGELACARAQLRALRPLPVESPRFDVGPQSGAGADELALAILADYLGASRDPGAYAMPLGMAGTVWDLHQRFRARWLAPLQLGAGELAQLSAAELEDWLAAEADSIPGATTGIGNRGRTSPAKRGEER